MLKERKRKEAAQTNNQMTISGQDRILPLFFVGHPDYALIQAENGKKKPEHVIHTDDTEMMRH